MILHRITGDNCTAEEIEAAIFGSTAKSPKFAAAAAAQAEDSYSDGAGGWEPPAYDPPEDELSRYRDVAQQNCFAFYCEEWTALDQYTDRLTLIPG